MRSGVNMFAMLTGNLPFTVEPFTIRALHSKMMKGDMNAMPDHLSKGRLYIVQLTMYVRCITFNSTFLFKLYLHIFSFFSLLFSHYSSYFLPRIYNI